jgi:nucleoside-diphosphate-sugar epimerase
VHLVGILKATAFATYQAAHEDSCAALVEALATSSVKHITYLSIVGSKPDAANACLASKGQAEAILAAGGPGACTLRVPMVLGEGDYASGALRRRASGKNGFVFRGESLEQPIYAGDVVSAICAASTQQLEGGYDLGGPECLTRKELYQRGADLFANTPIFVSLPIGLGYLVAGALEQFLGNPPITTAMLGVLDHDDNIDPEPTMKHLGMEKLTPLDDMLKAVLVAD